MKHQITFIVKDKNESHEYTIKAPNAGEILAIENLKASLTPYYREIAEKGTSFGNLALDTVDMTAHLTILCPELIRNMQVPIMKMGLPDLLQLKKAYITQFAPWWSEWNKLINHIDEKAMLASEEDKAKLAEEFKKDDQLEEKKEINTDLH
jgi:hypothetical protein